MGETALDKIVIVIGRMFGWGILGAVCGVSLGLITGLLHIPPDNPGDPLANEWYGLGVIITMFFECCAGGLLGAGIAVVVRGPSARTRAFLLAILGAVLGVGAARLMPDQGDDALVLSMFFQAVGVVAILVVGALRWARLRRLAHRARENR